MTTADRSVTGSRGPGHPYKSEGDLMRAAMLYASERHYRLFRNNTGVLMDHRGVPVRFGLATGSGDLIGLRSIAVRPEHVGTAIGQFVSIELKRGSGKPTDAQVAWLDMVRRYGGIAGVVRSIDDLEALLC